MSRKSDTLPQQDIYISRLQPGILSELKDEIAAIIDESVRSLKAFSDELLHNFKHRLGCDRASSPPARGGQDRASGGHLRKPATQAACAHMDIGVACSNKDFVIGKDCGHGAGISTTDISSDGNNGASASDVDMRDDDEPALNFGTSILVCLADPHPEPKAKTAEQSLFGGVTVHIG